MSVEFMQWYEPGMGLVRCGGDDGCGSVLLAGDTEQHLKWHAKVEAVAALDARRQWERVLGVPERPPSVVVADGPNHHTATFKGECSLCPGRGRPCEGPHDCSKM